MPMRGPLDGVRVLEFAGIGPAPFCAMLLADLGADVVRVERAGDEPYFRRADPVTTRGRSMLALDLKAPDGFELALAALEHADVLLEGFRPGVMERLGLGPEVALRRNPRLIYGRMTGWGQSGPLAHAAGHDINYIALTGALAAIGPANGPPVPPLNLVGDFGGGALYLALGIVAALYERERSRAGQVIDAAVVDGAASLMALFHGMTAKGTLSLERGRRLLGGDAPNYRCYECADGRYVAVGALEPKFFAELLNRLEISASADDNWTTTSQKLAAAFKRKTRDEWAPLFEGTDACVAPVLALDEAPSHPHLRARGVYAELDGIVQPAAAPRFSRTPGEERNAADESGHDALRRWGVEAG
ncbi:MAG: CoA transferase [Candidatus Eremiobacteraeota bacterium]|nr:CoA transferase [Candidatus Eremiobacteraeota bacterium]